MSKIGWIAALLSLSLLACGPTREEFQELSDRQAEILEKLTKLEEGQIQLLARRPGGGGGPPPAAGPSAENFDRVYPIEVGEAPIRGNAEAPVTIVAFSDFQCPFCASANPILEQALAKYPDDVRLVYKHFPLSFHRQARPAAVAALAANEQGRFWEMHDLLFANQAELEGVDIIELAREAGLDVARFKADLQAKQEAYDQRITADYREGLGVDVRGTPTIYVNGKKLRERSIEAISAQIEGALRESS